MRHSLSLSPSIQCSNQVISEFRLPDSESLCLMVHDLPYIDHWSFSFSERAQTQSQNRLAIAFPYPLYHDGAYWLCSPQWPHEYLVALGAAVFPWACIFIMELPLHHIYKYELTSYLIYIYALLCRSPQTKWWLWQKQFVFQYKYCHCWLIPMMCWCLLAAKRYHLLPPPMNSSSDPLTLLVISSSLV